MLQNAMSVAITTDNENTKIIGRIFASEIFLGVGAYFRGAYYWNFTLSLPLGLCSILRSSFRLLWDKLVGISLCYVLA